MSDAYRERLPNAGRTCLVKNAHEIFLPLRNFGGQGTCDLYLSLLPYHYRRSTLQSTAMDIITGINYFS